MNNRFLKSLLLSVVLGQSILLVSSNQGENDFSSDDERAASSETSVMVSTAPTEDIQGAGCCTSNTKLVLKRSVQCVFLTALLVVGGWAMIKGSNPSCAPDKDPGFCDSESPYSLTAPPQPRNGSLVGNPTMKVLRGVQGFESSRYSSKKEMRRINNRK